MTSEPTYTNRRIDYAEVLSIDPVRHSAWFDNPPPDELVPALKVGDKLDIECKGSKIAGWRHNGTWFTRKSDQDLQREHEALVADIRRRDEERLERCRDDWERRTAALPHWLQARLRHFVDRGGREFALSGWGYELVICELAVMLDASDLCDTDDVQKFCSEQGVSGNQHDFAHLLVKAHREGTDLSGTVAALAVITGDPDYSGSTK